MFARHHSGNTIGTSAGDVETPESNVPFPRILPPGGPAVPCALQAGAAPNARDTECGYPNPADGRTSLRASTQGSRLRGNCKGET